MGLSAGREQGEAAGRKKSSLRKRQRAGRFGKGARNLSVPGPQGNPTLPRGWDSSGRH
ncbi:hypothetical protein NC651_025818 [Populus alba x Populus x berolinensis]|nr:hypothetical protein NC651_025818 [Populus alba x Populus x berolinensis]